MLALEADRRYPLLLIAVFLSGASALMFETLWFRLCGLMLGSGVWASSLVLAGFMTGLAVGNGLSGRVAARLRRPLVAYAGLEATIGVLGLGLVLLLPGLTELMVPLFRSLVAHPLALNALRLVAAFALMLAPAAAMGATLPTLVTATAADESQFGSILGRLYGWNTLGAVAGTLAGEMFALEAFGVRGTGALACLMNLTGAFIALRLARGVSARPPAPSAPPRDDSAVWSTVWRPLVAASVCGAILLALEVVWFRFLTFYMPPTGLTFAVILAVVLLGISAGGLLGARWCRRHPEAPAFIPHLALLAGCLTIASYVLFDPSGTVRYVVSTRDVLPFALRLCFPVCVASGLLFVLLGTVMEQRTGARTQVTAAVTVANTVGAMLGATLAALVLLPKMGTDASIRTLALAYAVVCAATLRSAPRRQTLGLVGLAGALAAAVALFPTGLAERVMRAQIPEYLRGQRVVAIREGVAATLVYLREDRWEEPFAYRLMTNGLNMSGTNIYGRRYMKIFVYWPLALRPDSRSALLICYGVGNTARALTDSPGLTSIDVVDISPETLEMGALVLPPRDRRLADPRVRLHVEDGRFFLLSTDRRFDLITAEPPPPKTSGVVNLYSREYFQLVHDRLTDGGIATHWLPVYQLTLSDARSIMAGFCSVFADCSLWSGHGLEWMLVGTRGLAHGPSDDAFARQWQEPSSAPELRAVGLELPEQLGALFLGDAEVLHKFAGDHPPLEDDYPLRLSRDAPRPADHEAFVQILDAPGARARFEHSGLVRRLWPPGLRERSLAFFGVQAAMNRTLVNPTQGIERLEQLRLVLLGSPLRALALWLMDTNEDEVHLAERAAARGVKDPVIDYVRGLSAMADRDWERARAHMDAAETVGAPVKNLLNARVMARALGGDRDGALRLAREGGAQAEFVAWLERSFPPAPPK